MRAHHAIPISLLILVVVALLWVPGELGVGGKGFTRAVLISAALAWLFFGIRLRTRAWRVRDTPTSKVIAATVGQCELDGTVDAAAPRPAPASQIPSVWFKWELQEYRRSGKNSKWMTVDESEHRAGFVLRDDSGAIFIDPVHAEFHGFETFRHRVPGRGRRWRQVERLLPQGARAYVLGPVRARAGAGGATLEVACDDNSDEYLISDDSERRIARRFGAWAWVSLIFGFAAIALAPMVNVDVEDTATSDDSLTFHSTGETSLALVLAIVYVAVLASSWLLRVYNRLVIVRNQAEKAWASIEVQLQRRYDLLNNLVAVVQGYVEHERATLTAVAATRARGSLPDDDEVAAASAHNAVAHADARSLLALAEAYPALKASEQFARLAEAVTDCENRLAWSRSFYNDAINLMRDRHQTFPYVLVAAWVKMPSLELFAAEAGAGRVPDPV